MSYIATLPTKTKDHQRYKVRKKEMRKVHLRFMYTIILFIAVMDGYASENHAAKTKTIPSYIEALNTRDWDGAMDALEKIGAPAVDQLITAMNEPSDGSAWKQRRAAQALGKIGSQKAENALLTALANERMNSHIHRSVAKALGNIGSSDARDALVKTCQDRSKNINLRATAVYTLANFPSKKTVELLTEAMKSGEMPIQYRAGEALAEIGSSEAVEALVDGLKINPTCIFDEAVREALVNLPTEETCDVLVSALHSERWTVRWSSAETLERIGEPAAIALMKALKDSDSLVRWNAIRLLGNLQSNRMITSLVEALRDDHWMVRNEAAVHLVRLNSMDAVDPLMKMLKDDNFKTCEKAAWILGEIGAKEAENRLIVMLQEKGPSAWMAAISLGKLRSEKSVERLVDGLKGHNLQIRRASAWALAQIISDESRFALKGASCDEDEEVRFWADMALVK